MMLERINKANLFGVGTLPTILTAPTFIASGKTITLDVFPLTANADTAKINFIGVTGTEEEIMDDYRRARDEIRLKIEGLIENIKTGSGEGNK